MSLYKVKLSGGGTLYLSKDEIDAQMQRKPKHLSDDSYKAKLFEDAVKGNPELGNQGVWTWTEVDDVDPMPGAPVVGTCGTNFRQPGEKHCERICTLPPHDRDTPHADKDGPKRKLVFDPASYEADCTTNEVVPGSVWRHRNGEAYTVRILTNEDSRNPEYVPTVVYEGVRNGKYWSRPLADWHRSFTRV